MPGIVDDFLISLVNGETISPSDLLKGLLSGKSYYGYGIDSYGDIVVTKFLEVTKSEEKEELSKIVMLDESEIKGFSPGQKIITMNSSKSPSGKTIDSLISGEFLYPLAKFMSGNNEVLIRQKETHVVSVYRLADFYNVRNNHYTDEPGELYYPIHIDGNKKNNYPENIKRLTPEEAGIKPVATTKSLFELTEGVNKLGSMYKREADTASMISKNKSANPNYYSNDDRHLETRERFKLAEEKRKEKICETVEGKEALELAFEVDKIETWKDELEVPVLDYVYQIVTETNSFALDLGFFLG